MFHDMGWGMMGFAWIFWLIILVVIIWGVVMLVKNTQARNQSSPPHQSKTALDIIKERYARGEITREEFEQMKKDVQS